MLAPMRYKSFVWPNNPKNYTVSFQRQTALHKVLYGDDILEDLGTSCRCMRGEGEFFGPEAYENFRKLAAVFQEDGPGVLFHPTWMTTSAYFTELSLKQEPRTDYVAYAFSFVESVGSTQMVQVDATASAAAEVYYTVCQGDSLWSIGSRYGLSTAELLALNPSLANANELQVGGKVRVA